MRWVDFVCKLALTTILLVLGIAFAISEAGAQNADAVGALPAAVPAASWDSLVDGIGKLIGSWDSVAWPALVIAAANILTNLTKVPLVAGWFEADEKRKKWRSWIAAGLGAALGFATAVATGVAILPAIVQGLFSGLGAVGIHELVNAAKPEKPTSA